MSSTTTSPAFFEAKYKQQADPWDFAASRYELDRYATILASLKPNVFENAFEAGCSIGVLTSQLAIVCRQLVALDVSPTAVSQAHERCRDLANVDIRVGSLPADLPDVPFNLIVFSEIGYYFQPDELSKLGKQLTSQMAPGGLLLAAHWLGTSEDHILSGDQVHETLAALPDLKRTFSQRYDGYRMDHWKKV